MGRIAQTFDRFSQALRTPGGARKFVFGAASVMLIQVGGVVSAYVLQVILANVMGSRGFGDYIYAYNWARLLALFGGLGLTLSVLKFVPTYLEEKEWGRLKGLLFAFSGATLVASAVLAVLVLGFFVIFPPSDIDQTTLAIGLLVTPLYGLMSLYVQFLRGMEFVTTAYLPMSVGQNVLMMGGIMAMLVFFGEVGNVQAITLLLIVVLLIVAFQLWTILRKLPAIVHKVRPVYETREWLRTSLPMLFIKGFDVLMSRVDVLLVGFLLGAIPTAIYAVASRTASMAVFPMIAANSMVAPRIAPLYRQGKHEELNKLVQRGTRLSMSVSLVAVIALVIFSYPLLALFGEEFVVGQRTMFILLIGFLINASTGPVSMLLSLTEHERVNGRIYGTVLMVNVVLNIAFIQFTSLGIEGVAIATAFSMALRNVWLYFEVRRRLGISTVRLF